MAVAEVVSSPGALCLGQLGMDLESAHAAEWSVALEAAAELIEDGSSKCDLGSAVEVDDGLERTSFTGSRGLVLAKHKLVESWRNVLEAGNIDVLLRHTLVGRLLVLVDALGEVETGAQSLPNQIDDVSWDGSREHEVLAFHLLRVRQVLSDVVNLPLEAVVQQAIGLVHDECIEVRCLDARIRVPEDIVESAGGANKDVASLALRLHEHGALLGAAHGCLDDDAGAARHFLGLDGDLLGQLAGGGDDNGSDVVCLCPLVSPWLVCEGGVVLENALDNGDEKAERLAGARLCLCDPAQVSSKVCTARMHHLHVDAAQCLADGPCLDIGHGGELHLLGDGVDQVWVDKPPSGELAELCDGSI